jgi:hypothetical protein
MIAAVKSLPFFSQAGQQASFVTIQTQKHNAMRKTNRILISHLRVP